MQGKGLFSQNLYPTTFYMPSHVGDSYVRLHSLWSFLFLPVSLFTCPHTRCMYRVKVRVKACSTTYSWFQVACTIVGNEHPNWPTKCELYRNVTEYGEFHWSVWFFPFLHILTYRWWEMRKQGHVQGNMWMKLSQSVGMTEEVRQCSIKDYISSGWHLRM